jgi:hypothetical protein
MSEKGPLLKSSPPEYYGARKGGIDSLLGRALGGRDIIMPNKRYWMGDNINQKDDFGRPITDEFIDGKTRLGPWAIMSPTTHRIQGMGLGMGRGQRYRKQEDGRWIKVEG